MLNLVLSAIGLSLASGLRPTLPLLGMAVLTRFGAIHLAAPFDLLGSNLVIGALILALVTEVLADKVPGLDSVARALLFPLTIGGGALVYAAEVSSSGGHVDPDFATIGSLAIGAALAGSIFTVRATVRPILNVLAFLGPPISLAEDAAAVALVATAIWAPLLVPLVLVILVVGIVSMLLLAVHWLRVFFDWVWRRFGGRGRDDSGDGGNGGRPAPPHDDRSLDADEEEGTVADGDVIEPRWRIREPGTRRRANFDDDDEEEEEEEEEADRVTTLQPRQGASERDPRSRQVLLLAPRLRTRPQFVRLAPRRQSGNSSSSRAPRVQRPMEGEED